MSYKEKTKQEVKTIIATGKDVEAKIIAMIRKDYLQTKEDSKAMGQSLENMTYELLEGIEDGLKSTTYDTKEILKKSSEAMADAVKESADASIAKSNQLLKEAQTKLHESAESAQNTAKDKVDAAYEALYQKTKAEKKHLKEVSEGIEKYSKEKVHGVLSSSIQKTKDAIIHVDNSFKDHSKRLLNNVEQKTSSFNHTLIAKIKKHI